MFLCHLPITSTHLQLNLYLQLFLLQRQYVKTESVAQPKNLVCHNGQALAVGKGMILQSKKGHQVLDVDNSKKRSVSIEIRATTKLIHEVEKLIYIGEYPDPVLVEKAKSLLKEQERAIIDALEKLADLSDDGLLLFQQ